MSYISSPLANSTKITNNFCSKGSDRIVSTHLTVSNSSRVSVHKCSTTKVEQKNSTFNDITTVQDIVTETSISSISILTSSANAVAGAKKGASCLKDSARRSIGRNKTVVSRKVSAKKVTEPIKAIAYNGVCNNAVTVEKILKQINMTKYQQAFKRIDVAKFKELKEIDLNAIGITRPSEIKTFMDAIKKTKSDIGI